MSVNNDLSVVTEILSPHIKKINACITSGFKKALEAIVLIEQHPKILSKRSRSSFIRDFIINEAVHNFPDQIIEKSNGLSVLKIDNFVIKFKKLDKHFRSSSIKTKQVGDYLGQLPIDGIKGVHLEAGYVLDESGYSIISTHLTCPNGHARDWVLNMREYVENKSILPLTPLLELANTSAKELVAVKETAKQKRKRKKEINE